MGKVTRIGLLFMTGCVFAWFGITALQPLAPEVLSIRIQKMSGIPDEEAGFSLGVSACYAGIVDNQLLMAGGCNFPEVPVADGGTKRFYQGIYAANLTADSTLAWRKIGDLPVPAAYGVTVSIPGGLILVGGMNANGSLSSVYRLLLSKNKKSVTIDTLRSLPYPMDNLAGTLMDNTLYVVGGNVKGKPSNCLYSYLYTDPRSAWTEEPSFPGDARVQPVCAGQSAKGMLYVWGGFAPYVEGKSATVSTGGYVYSLAQRTWTPLSAPVGNDFVPVSLGGGCAWTLNDSLIVCTGGVNEKVFLSGLQRDELLKKDIAANHMERVDSLTGAGKIYLSHPADWYRFNKKILVYNTLRNVWMERGQSPALARAGAALVGYDKILYSINGELKPGIRTPEINKIKIDN
ncbi:MAG: cyclically-permuted mutarotase family protein [Bacteroides sp.]